LLGYKCTLHICMYIYIFAVWFWLSNNAIPAALGSYTVFVVHTFIKNMYQYNVFVHNISNKIIKYDFCGFMVDIIISSAKRANYGYMSI